MNLDKIVNAVKQGVAMAGGTPVVFPAIAVCDGIAMGHIGMKYSLVTKMCIRDRISCHIKVTDSSSIKRVTLTLKGPVSTDHPVAVETEIEMKYNKKTGYYEGSVNKEKGTYRVENVYAAVSYTHLDVYKRQL